MKRNLLLIFAIVLVTGFLFSCSNKGEILHKNITGRANELVVVITDDSWDGVPGETLRGSLGQAQAGLPQIEPLFDLVRVPPAGFKSIFQSTRNILQTSISPNVEKPEVVLKDNVWAYPQATVQVKAKNAEQFREVYLENEDKIMSYFLSAERKRLTMNYKKYYEKGIYNVLDKDFGVTMMVPPGFVIAEQKEDFIWYKFETPEISQGIILYTIPYSSDSTFTTNYLLSVRDSVLKANVPGPTKGSYMGTERRFDQMQSIFEHNGNYASEMRGLWRLYNDYMGGPYIALAELDASNQRVVVAFGYVYAPSKDKRNLLRQVEAMIYSLKLNNQAENDKINSEVKMGN